MFRYRIKDLMIVNTVLAVTLAVSMAWHDAISGSQGSMILRLLAWAPVPIALGVVIFAPLACVEAYLYRRKKGSWYRWKHPRPSRRYQAPTDLPPRSPTGPGSNFGGAPEGNPRDRTRLFQAGSSTEPVSRASLLLSVATKLEKAGRLDAAGRVCCQILKNFATTAPARDAAHRLQSLEGTGALLNRTGAE